MGDDIVIDEVIYAQLNPLAPTTHIAAALTANPRITYLRIAGRDNGNLQGAGPGRYNYQIDSWSLDPKTSRLLADAAKVALRAGLTVGAITDNPDDYEADTKLFRASFDVAAWTT
jgi:hypothetical protein